MSGKRKGDHLPSGSQLSKRQEREEKNAVSSPDDPPRVEGTAIQVQQNDEIQAPARSHDQPVVQEKSIIPPVEAHHSVLPLSMQLMKFWNMNCVNCAPAPRPNGSRFSSLHGTGPRHHSESTPSFIGIDGQLAGEGLQFCSPVWKEGEVNTLEPDTSTGANENEQVVPTINGTDESNLIDTNGTGLRNRRPSKLASGDNNISHLESIRPSPRSHTLTIMQEYLTATQMYGCKDVNPGVLTALRFSLPTLRVAGSFHDADMLALAEVLFRHCNGALKHIRRLDFSIAGRFGKLHGRKGFGSHGT